MAAESPKSATWGDPLESELDSVVDVLLQRYPESVGAAESLYGVSRTDRTAFGGAIRHAMQVGGIRRTDGRKWGIGGIVGDIEISPIARDEVPQKTASTQSGPRQAVVTGVWALGFFAEPGVRTSQRVSPGAELSVLEVTSAGN